MARPILVGAVVYDPKVVTIWEIIKQFFRDEGLAIDYVFYSNYALQVDALVEGQIDIAWNSPLAWVDTERRTGGRCRAIAMRDTDRDRVTRILTRRDSGIASLDDLRGRTIATGAIDSPQATLIPLHLLRTQGLEPGAGVEVRRFDVAVGKHGDHVGGELDALRAVRKGEADACAVLDLNWSAWKADGTADAETIVEVAATPPYDHCNFSVLERFPADRQREWLDVLYRMSYENPDHREMMDMEGLKEWLPGRTEGYAQLSAAVEASGFFESEAARAGA